MGLGTAVTRVALRNKAARRDLGDILWWVECDNVDKRCVNE